MQKSRLLDTVISHCLIIAMLGLLLFLIYPTQSAACLSSLNPFTSNKGVYRSATGNYISDGKMVDGSEPIPPPPFGQKAKITGSLAKDWEDWSGWANLTAHYDMDSSGCYASNTCQRIDIPQLNSGFVTFAHSLRLPAGIYTGDLWLRSSGRSAVIVAVKNGDESSEVQQFERRLLVGTEWKHVELSGRCPGWDNAAFTVSSLSGGTSLWIADVRLERRFDWLSLLIVLGVIAAGVGISHFVNLVVFRALTAKDARRQTKNPG